MARLYCEIFNEKVASVHKTANKDITARFYYSSKEDSKLALRVFFKWDDGHDKPTAYVTNVDCEQVVT